MDNILKLHRELKKKTYAHGSYHAFNISDPKPRNIHKASVRDRLFHHAVYRVMYPFFDKRFIIDSFSCRLEKGAHKAINRFRSFFRRASKNNTKTCWVLKCDIRKFFENIDHETLISTLEKYRIDEDALWLLKNIIGSFSSKRIGIGLPLGNLTSQLLVNVYMSEFDHHVKHMLKAQYYIRYADDFCVLSDNRERLKKIYSRDGKLFKRKTAPRTSSQ
ncbi:MAG: hypothetical protein COU08_02570 [Candidatus Harrisonbacteria bacterium CG10_big_fil_rev_8_21_14_0_10_42_17]|uniref:Reverse transcriptase domain-containing protein n=1 Tax=Candidatus Harrisonbacteria bacterium CG10_big_fil_rev_8_21_14_0_10_42_17 TaxID=1974584 RepID=A0A2M6WI07_9BACT|nr:MAG: hypothetical protein COU08_02570 [Candidatus Harrisonbacteria bacterium CG10_big_fil_rev_8_21_14_0_10_42_17]